MLNFMGAYFSKKFDESETFRLTILAGIECALFIFMLLIQIDDGRHAWIILPIFGITIFIIMSFTLIKDTIRAIYILNKREKARATKKYKKCAQRMRHWHKGA